MKNTYCNKGDSHPLILSKRSLLVGICRAISKENKPCQCYAVKGQVFCRIHLAQGYGLFTLAALARLEYSAPPDIVQDG